MKNFLLTLTLGFLFAFSASAQPLLVSTQFTPACQDDGTITSTVTGGTPPYQYVWTYAGNPAWGPQFTPNLSGLHQGFYQVTVTDAAGDLAYGYAYVEATFSAYVTTTGDTCNLGKGTAKAIVQGVNGPYTYQWFNGATTDSISNLNQGPVSVIITDINGCYINTTDLDSFGISAFNVGYVPSFSISFTSTLSTCMNGTATANVNGGVFPYTYSWNTTPVQTTQTATGLKAKSTFEVIVTDASGCTGDNFVYINTGSNLSINSITKPDTCGAGNGSITITAIAGTPPYSYLWNNGNTSTALTGLSTATIYSVTVTDNIGCETNGAFYINAYSPLNLTTTTIPSSCTAATGSISAIIAGGTAPFTYSWMTSPVQTTSTASNLAAGTYTVYITDANGCSGNFSTVLNDNSNLTIATSVLANENCINSDGSANVTASSGVPPYTYSWNSFPVQTVPTAVNLSYGLYKATVTDAAGCVRSKNVYIGRNNPLVLTGTITNATCIYTADGQISVNVTAGTSPYTYSWSNGQTTPSISGLLPGNYNIAVTDANGCVATQIYKVDYTSISPCAAEIKGMVYSDVNANCNFDWNEYVNSMVKVYCTPDGSFRFTDNNGTFSFIKSTAGSFSLDMILPFWYDWTCGPRPQPVTIPSLGNTVFTELPIAGNALDMIVNSQNVTPARPGFGFRHLVSYRNQGSMYVNNMTMKVNYDPLLTFNGSSPVPVSVNAAAGEIYYSVSGYPGSGYQSIELNFTADPSMSIGYQLSFSDSIFTTVTDTVPLNNFYTVNETVVGSFDPNDIAVSPQGFGLPGYINNSDSVLTYTIRFQNTGNYPATNVVVKVQADPDLDIQSLEYLGGTFPGTIDVSASGLITFSYMGIYLPDSIMNEPESHGSLVFTMKQLPGLSSGTPISMQADIYFDFNAPVTTNIALNTITGIESIAGNSNGLVVYPVPASDKLNVKIERSIDASYAKVYDMTGRLVKGFALQQGQIDFSIDVRNMPDGLYLLNVEGERSGVSSRFIKQ